MTAKLERSELQFLAYTLDPMEKPAYTTLAEFYKGMPDGRLAIGTIDPTTIQGALRLQALEDAMNLPEIRENLTTALGVVAARALLDDETRPLLPDINAATREQLEGEVGAVGSAESTTKIGKTRDAWARGVAALVMRIYLLRERLAALPPAVAPPTGPPVQPTVVPLPSVPVQPAVAPTPAVAPPTGPPVQPTVVPLPSVPVQPAVEPAGPPVIPPVQPVVVPLAPAPEPAKMPSLDDRRRSAAIGRLRPAFTRDGGNVVTVDVELSRGRAGEAPEEIVPALVGRTRAYARRYAVTVYDAATKAPRLAWAYVIYLDRIGPGRIIPGRAISTKFEPGRDPRVFGSDDRDNYAVFSIRVPAGPARVQSLEFNVHANLNDPRGGTRFSQFYFETRPRHAPYASRIYVKVSPQSAKTGRLAAIADVQRIYYLPIGDDPAAAGFAPGASTEADVPAPSDEDEGTSSGDESDDELDKPSVFTRPATLTVAVPATGSGLESWPEWT
jgi:hypothetical protein